MQKHKFCFGWFVDLQYATMLYAWDVNVNPT